jgi:hypothetical protein
MKQWSSVKAFTMIKAALTAMTNQMRSSACGSKNGDLDKKKLQAKIATS